MDKAFESEAYEKARSMIKSKKQVILTTKPQYDTYTQDAVITNLSQLNTVFKYCDRMKYDIINIS